MSSARTAPTAIIPRSATEIARLIAAGELSAREVVEAHIARIEAVNPRLNAVVVPLLDQARAEAVAADAARARGEAVGLLDGVPITVKESFDVAGTPTTVGLGAWAKQRAASDAFVVARLRAAGAILLGKTNVSQFLMTNESDNPVYGRTNNPWNIERAPGGSSGGEAAILAAGGSALGLGSDIGGSVRLPATACGICSLKPTSGRLTMLGHFRVFPGQEAILAQPGPMARSVEDLALAMKILAAPGQEAVDPNVPPVPLGDPARVSLKGLRVAFYTDNNFFAASPAFRRAVREAATALRARGAEPEEWNLPEVAEAWRIYTRLLFADGMACVRRGVRHSERDRRIRLFLQIYALPKSLRLALAWTFERLGQHRSAVTLRNLDVLSADQYWNLVARRTQYRTRFLAALDASRFDAVLCPADGLPALTHGASAYVGDALSYTAPYNLLGMPAGVLAVTRVRPDEESDRPRSRDLVERTAQKVEAGSAGLPVGVQVVARHWREDVVLALMAALEEHFRGQTDYPAYPPI